MKKEKINLFGRDLFITERIAFDVYEFEAYSKSKKDKTNLDLIYEDALFVSQGLRYNLSRLCFKIREINIPFRLIRYLILKRKLSPVYLMKHLSFSQLQNFINKIWFLETGEDLDKKKVMTKVGVKGSAGKQPIILSEAVSV